MQKQEVTIQDVIKEAVDSKEQSLINTQILLEDQTKLDHIHDVNHTTSIQIQQGKYMARGFTLWGAIKNLFVGPPRVHAANKKVSKESQEATQLQAKEPPKKKQIPKDSYDVLLSEVNE